MTFGIRHIATGGWIAKGNTLRHIMESGKLAWRLVRSAQEAHVFPTPDAANEERRTFDGLDARYEVVQIAHSPTGADRDRRHS